jgi:hypothetical protein
LCYFDKDTFNLKDLDGIERTRTVFVLSFVGNDFIKEKVLRVCAGLECTIYSLPDDGDASPQLFNKALVEYKQNITKVISLVKESKKQMRSYLIGIQKLQSDSKVS